MILAGIDEAGLGPILGPLVCSACAWEVESADGPIDLWDRLDACVARKPSRRAGGRVSICDSKKLFHRTKTDGLAPLERSVLTCWTQLDQSPAHAALPATLGEWLDAVSPSSREPAADYPWYGPCELAMPRYHAPDDISLAANAMHLGLGQAGVRLAALRAQTLRAREYNDLIDRTDNKSAVTFGVTCSLLRWLWDEFAEQNMHITVDRQGGRMHHRTMLQQVFEEASLRIIEESTKRSAYLLRTAGREVTVEFIVEAESHSLPTALASMLSKYLRELHMELFNGFWAQHVEDLKPTAGYFQDGRRFLGEIAPAIEALDVDTRLLIRQR
jgi:ribonuclease HII